MHRDYEYLIIGAGMVADAAANGIRERDESGSIGILGEEPTPPFPRPALSKKLWTDPDFTVENTDPGTAEKTGAEIHTDTRATAIDRDARTVSTQGGDTFGYQHLLIATGGHPKQIGGLPPGDRVLYYRTLTDYHRLRELTGSGPNVAVVGGGYIGSEIAAALVQNGCTVTMVFPDVVLGRSTFPDSLANEFEKLFTDAGVEVLSGLSVLGGTASADGVVLEIDDDSELEVDVVVVGLGIEPAGDLAGAAGLELSEDGGIVVDEHLTTSDPLVLAAGDVADYPDRILGRRRVEHVDNAGEMGAAAGRIMAGSTETYDHTPMFYSDVLGVGYEAVGTLDGTLDTVVQDVDEEHGGGKVVYYLSDSEVAGVLLWDTGDALEDAKALLAAHEIPESVEGAITPSAG